MRTAGAVGIAGLVIIGLATGVAAQEDGRVWLHGSTLIGDLKYPEGFRQFDYVNADAPQGGTVRLSTVGSFDTFNAYIPTGNSPAGLGLIYDTLMTRPLDESSARYGLLAEGLSIADDYSSVTYRLREGALWHDGEPITVDDVVWTFNTLKEINPFIAAYYEHVTSAEQTGPRDVTFHFDEAENRELPTIVGELAVLPRHYWEGTDADGAPRDITQPTLEPPLGSGPYRIGQFDAGRTIGYERVRDYWGNDLPVNVGYYNFDEVRYEYYLDETVMFEAFKADEYDFRDENRAARWANEYNFAAAEDGRVQLLWFEPEIESATMLGFVFNLRRPEFQDPRVRQALVLAFPFEAVNRDLFYGQYYRPRSYFDGLEFQATGEPQGRELEILEGLRDQVPPEVFGEPYANPVAETPEQQRENLRLALDLLTEAGWELDGNTLVNAETGAPLVIEWLNQQPTLEPPALRYQEELASIGIEMQIRTVDSSQFLSRVNSFDFDMVYLGWTQSNSPGNELLGFFDSSSADVEGSSNYAGISDPAVDAIIDEIITADDRDALIAASRALDRVLTYSYYLSPGWDLRASRLAYWDRFGHPDEFPAYSTGFPVTWWYDEERAARIGAAP